MAPRQRVLEGVKEVPEHPGQDGVVENAHQEWHHHRGNAYVQEIILSGGGGGGGQLYNPKSDLAHVKMSWVSPSDLQRAGALTCNEWGTCLLYFRPKLFAPRRPLQAILFTPGCWPRRAPSCLMPTMPFAPTVNNQHSHSNWVFPLRWTTAVRHVGEFLAERLSDTWFMKGSFGIFHNDPLLLVVLL